MKKILALIMALVLCVSVFASCSNPKDDGGANSKLEDAVNYIFQMYKDDPETTPNDYDVMAKVPVGDDQFYDVTWTVDVTEGVTVKESEKEGFYTIDVNETTATEIPYKLTATVTDEEGNTATKEFSRKVPAYALNTYDDYAAAKDEDPLTVQGIITGIMAKSDGDKENSVFVQDATNAGGYYLYGLEKDPLTELNLKVGMTVEASGAKKNFNGTHELVGVKEIKVVDSNIKTVTPVDYTEIFKKAEKTDDAALVAKQALLVTIKGVEVTDQETGSGYYKFKLDGVESYVRISSSSNCTTKAEADTMKKNHTEKQGYTADVTGLVSIYNGAFYLIPVSADAFANFVLGEKSVDDQVKHELNKISVPGMFIKDGEVVLPLKGTDYPNVTFTYAVTGNCLAFDAATGKLTIDADATEKAGKVTVTAKAEGATAQTKEFEIKLSAASSITDALLKEDNTEVEVSGIVISIKDAWDEQYSNMSYTIMDDKGNTLLLYRTKLQAAVGDFVTVKGKMATFSGARQLAAGSEGTKGTPDDAHKAAFELAQIKFETSYTADVDVTLPATKSMFDATIAWTKDNAAITKLTVAQTDESQKIALTVSVTVGSVTVTKDFEVTVFAKAGDALATFEFGDKVASPEKHEDGSALPEEGKTYTEGNYSLVIAPGFAKVYDGGNDLIGNSCLKLGTSSVAGSFSFTVAADVNQVVIKVAKYKDKNSKFLVNGVEQSVTTNSNDGAYTDVIVDTSTNKTVSVSTAEGGYRAMIDAIIFKA